LIAPRLSVKQKLLAVVGFSDEKPIIIRAVFTGGLDGLKSGIFEKELFGGDLKKF